MKATLERSGLEQKVAAAKKAVSELQAELSNLPEPKAMGFDEMLDRLLPLMEAERKRLTAEGVDLKKNRDVLNENPF